MADLPLPQQTYQSRSKPFSSERLLNLLLEKGGQASNKYMLIGTPGLKDYYNFGGDKPVLGMIYMRDFLIVATNDNIMVLYKNKLDVINQITSFSWGADIGQLNPTSPVQMVTNGDDVLILNSEAKKLVVVTCTSNEPEGGMQVPGNWTADAPAVPPTQPSDTAYTSIAYISGTFLASCQINGISYVQFTDVLDTELKYSLQLETALTNLTALKGNMREVWAFGANSIEVMAPTGEAGNNFFSHVPGAYINKGCVCKNSIATYESSFLFYGADGSIYMSDGYALKQISTPALLDMIKSWGVLQTEDQRKSVIGQVFAQSGHIFYALKFKAFGKTIMYDLTTSSWMERETGDGGEWEGEYVVRRPSGELLVSSKTKSILYKMDSDYHTDAGETICREFVFATISVPSKKRMFFHSLTLEVDTGLGPNDHVMLSWSDDGGYTWKPERMIALGDYGQYNRKLQFRRLGSSITRTFRVRLSTASMINVLRADVDFEQEQ